MNKWHAHFHTALGQNTPEAKKRKNRDDNDTNSEADKILLTFSGKRE